jgi:peptidoglycan/LPS O-acetylase OafA/YrhL
MTYRHEIDGIRAIAVLAVLFYHAGFGMFAGGYVGVDVFFVLSGYLITSIVLKSLSRGQFSIVQFYERRVLRLFPALFALLAVVAVLGWVLMTPSDLADLSAGAAATAGFGSNIYFWKTTGYFTVRSESLPLLHTWSLAIEEQFYLFHPLLLFFIHKWAPSRIRAALLALIGLSFAASCWAVAAHPSAAFYLLPFRTWELLVGAFLAVNGLPRVSERKAGMLSALGLAIVAWSVFTYNSSTAFPGAAALAPCLGTALLVGYADGTTGLGGRFLAHPLMIRIGKISYSLYLWHWPVFTLAKYALIRELSTAETWAALAASFLCAELSYRFVETPFRTNTPPEARVRVLAGGAAVAACAMALGLIGRFADGFPSRMPADAVQYARQVDDISPRRDECQDIPLERISAGSLCRLGPRDGRVGLIVWGDSHAGAMLPAFEKLAADTGVPMLFASQKACQPLLEVSRRGNPHNERCRAFNERMAEFARSRPDADIALVGRWSVVAQGFEETVMGNKKPRFEDGESEEVSVSENREVLRRGLERLLARVESPERRTWILREVPFAKVHVPSALARKALTGRSLDKLAIHTREHERWRAPFGTLLAKMNGAKNSVGVIDPAAAFCDNSRCRVERDGNALYTDSNHLSASGALLTIQQLSELVAARRPG